MKLELKTIRILILLFFPLYANALGVKDIRVSSTLNQPMDAKIALISIKGQDPQDIRVRLATPERFKKAGISRPYFLTSMKFKPIFNADGSGYIQVTSSDIIREPYLNFLLEISWRGGSLIKEYVVLLDPSIIRQATVTPQRETPKPEATQPTTDKKQTYGPVKKTENLWVIAEKTRPNKSIPIKQMVMAIHRDNPNAFMHGNINLLKRGAHLTIPNIKMETSAIPDNTRGESQEQEQTKKEQQPTEAEAEKSEHMDNETDVAKEELSTTTVKPETATTTTPENNQSAPAEEQKVNDSAEQEPAADATEQDDDAKLKVVAAPEEQPEEILQPQDNIAYPNGDIEQLSKSITEAKQDISSLTAINHNLIKLRTALKDKLALIQDELDKTNQTINVVSGKIADSDPTSEGSEITRSETDLTTEPAQAMEPETVHESAAVETQTEPENPTRNTAELKTPANEEPSVSEVKTDLAGITKLNKDKGDIEALKSQGQMLNVMKYVVIALAVIFLIILALIIANKRRNRKADENYLQEPYQDGAKPSSNSSNTPIISATNAEKPEDTDLNASQETTSDIAHDSQDKITSKTKHPSISSGINKSQTTDKSKSDTEILNNDLNNLQLKSSHNEADQDIDSIITTVDVYLAYGRLTEAKSILHNSIDKHPELPKLKAKLFEIYAFNKDTKLFTRDLERYKEELESKEPELWKDILAIAAQLIPDHPYVAGIHGTQTNEIPSPDSSASTYPEESNINLGSDTLVDDLVVGDIQTAEDELFNIDQNEQNLFDNVWQETTFDTKHKDSENTISEVVKPIAVATNQESQFTDKPKLHAKSLDDDLLTPDSLLFESDHNDTDQDIDSVITTVDASLAHGNFTEAESILHNSIDKHPELPKLKAKLFEVYAFSKDTKLFTRYLERYQEELESKTPELWEGVLTIAAQLIPDHPYVTGIHNEQTDEKPSTDSATSMSLDESKMNLGPDTLVEELVVGDIQISEDELFTIDQDEKDPFDNMLEDTASDTAQKITDKTIPEANHQATLPDHQEAQTTDEPKPHTDVLADDLIIGDIQISEDELFNIDHDKQGPVDDKLVIADIQISEDELFNIDQDEQNPVDDELVIGDIQISEDELSIVNQDEQGPADNELVIGDIQISEDELSIVDQDEQDPVDDELIIGNVQTSEDEISNIAHDKPNPYAEILDDDLPTTETLLSESSQKKTDQDIDLIITTVDVDLAYKRFTEAESTLHRSIEKYPELPKLKAKLFEIYAFNKDTKLFTHYLERYQEELESEAPELWEDILSTAAQLIPDHPYVADK
ncbi:MAG: hypothetical protein GY814_10710 [Gammaproteobacteria bacterium]|nr:hypothetical protein [Gammaproteobacteria bacterium]